MARFALPSPEDDDLFTPAVRHWSADKHHFLRRYLDAFTQAMKRKGWDALHYVDLFAGAGIEHVEGKGLDWGSPLIAAQSPVPFDQLHLVEKKGGSHDALAARLKRFPQPTAPQLLLGDANDRVHEVIEQISLGSLSLAFLDPYGLHLHYDTLKVLARRRVDLIIFFPDHMDALRNARFYYEGKPDSNLTRVLGTTEWESALNTAKPGQEAKALTDIYVKQIKALGYQYCVGERIFRSDRHPLYKLIFCSRNRAGGEIWRKTALHKPDGQRTFPFEGPTG